MSEIRNVNEIYDAILELLSQLDLEHNRFIVGNATAGRRARSITLKLGKLLTDYRKQSVVKAKVMALKRDKDSEYKF